MDLIRRGNFAFFKYVPLVEGLADPIYLLQIDAFFENVFYNYRGIADHPFYKEEKFRMSAYNKNYNPIFLVVNPDKKSLQLQAPIPILDTKGYEGYKRDEKGDYECYLQTLMTIQGKMRRFVFDRLKENGAIFSGENEVLSFDIPVSQSHYQAYNYGRRFKAINDKNHSPNFVRRFFYISQTVPFHCSDYGDLEIASGFYEVRERYDYIHSLRLFADLHNV